MRALLWVCCLVMVSTGASATDPADIIFKEGYALVLCAAPDGHAQVSTDLFNAAFPQWIRFLQEQAEEGVVNRAHYLGELKDGVFVVVQGATRQDAVGRADVLIDGILSILEQANQETRSTPDFALADACRSVEVGPLALLPR